MVRGCHSPGSFEAVAHDGDVLVDINKTTAHTNKRKRNKKHTKSSKGGHKLLKTNNNNFTREWLGTTGTFLRRNLATSAVKKIRARFPELNPSDNWTVCSNASHTINGCSIADLLHPFDCWNPALRQSYPSRSPAKVTEAALAYSNVAVTPAGYAPDQTNAANVLCCLGVLVCSRPENFGAVAAFARTGAAVSFYSLDTAYPLPGVPQLPGVADADGVIVNGQSERFDHWVSQAHVQIDPRNSKDATRFAALVNAALVSAKFVPGRPRSTIRLSPKPKAPKPPKPPKAKAKAARMCPPPVCRACNRAVLPGQTRVTYPVDTPWYGHVWRHTACLPVHSSVRPEHLRARSLVFALPCELLCCIVKFLDGPSLASFSSVCRASRAAVRCTRRAFDTRWAFDHNA